MAASRKTVEKMLEGTFQITMSMAEAAHVLSVLNRGIDDKESEADEDYGDVMIGRGKDKRRRKQSEDEKSDRSEIEHARWVRDRIGNAYHRIVDHRIAKAKKGGS